MKLITGAPAGLELVDYGLKTWPCTLAVLARSEVANNLQHMSARYSVRDDLRTLEFLRYVYNKILDLITTAKENGWPRPEAIEADPPPLAA